MNILLLSQFFSETRGGGEYVFKLLANSLVKNNHKVWIITNKIMEETYDHKESLNIIFVKPTLSYDSGKLPSFSDNLRYFINAIRVGLKIINKHDIDIIHSNNFSPAIVGSILSSLTSKPHVTSIWDIFSLCVEDYWQRWASQLGASGIHSFLGPRFEKLILKLPHNAIHTISESTRDDLVRFGATKPIHVISPSIMETRRLMITARPYQFIYVGRLVFYKNLEVIIKAIGIVRKEFPEVKLIIIGVGPHKKLLDELIKNLNLESNIQFTGYVDAEEKVRLLAESSALLFPSLCEGFGLVILEAFSLKRPVLVSNIRPMSDIVTHEENGYVLDPHDEKEWAEHLLKITKNPLEAYMMGKNGNKLLAKSYNQESMYQKIISMYNEVLKRASS